MARELQWVEGKERTLAMRLRPVLTGAVVCVLLSATAWAQPARQEKSAHLPSLDWNLPVWCLRDAKEKEFRVQIDTAPSSNRALVAPNTLGDGTALQGVHPCGRHPVFQTLDELEDSGVRLVAAKAEAPPGWHRDDRGRVFQVSFDLQRRFFIGAGWHPARTLDEGDNHFGRGYMDMGFQASWLTPALRMRHTISAIEGRITLDDLEADGQLFRYDLSHASKEPLLRLTTFFGEPTRHDINMDIGMGLRVLGVHHRPHRVEERMDMEYGELHAAWDMWQSSDLYNHVRLQVGAAGEGWYDPQGDLPNRYALVPNAEISFRFGLDHNGFHYVDGATYANVPVMLNEDELGSTWRRAGAHAGYELVFLAVNDQPLSLRLEGKVSYRDDLPQGAPELDASGLTGLRLSFWAPPRDHTTVSTSALEPAVRWNAR